MKMKFFCTSFVSWRGPVPHPCYTPPLTSLTQNHPHNIELPTKINNRHRKVCMCLFIRNLWYLIECYQDGAQLVVRIHQTIFLLYNFSSFEIFSTKFCFSYFIIDKKFHFLLLCIFISDFLTRVSLIIGEQSGY